MNKGYLAKMLRASGPMRSPDAAAVSRVIHDALGAAGLTGMGGTPPSVGPDVTITVPRRAPFAGRVAGKGSVPPVLDGKALSGQMPAAAGVSFAGLPGLGRVAVPANVVIPEGARFLDAQYSCEAGGRRYRLYVPSTAGDGLRGMIVMLHGCTQNPEDFAAGTGMNDLAERHRLLIVYPAQTGCDNSMSCWNWFRPADQVRDSGEPSIIAGLTVSLRDEYSVPKDRVFVAGLSAGGAMAAIMGETYPDVYAAVGVHSGPAHSSAVDVISALAAMRGQPAGGADRRKRPADGAQARPRMIVFHGAGDKTVHPSNAERVIADFGGSQGRTSRTEHPASGDRRAYSRLIAERDDGSHGLECWMIDGAPHAWAGGHPSGTYTDPNGPDASAAMVGFFLHGSSDRTTA